MTLKMHSRRTIGVEAINNENLSGRYLADGALYLYGRGDDYEGIFPAWNWRQLPGTTCPQAEGPLPPPSREKPGDTFVGGVTDGKVSAAAMQLDRDGLSARKAYFFDGDEVLCLGAGIGVSEGSANGANIVTTVNQCLKRGEVKSKPVTTQVSRPGTPTMTWIEHDGVRYTFAPDTTPQSSVRSQTGNWNKVFRNPTTPKDDITLDVFSLTIDHGVNPQAAGYAWISGPAGRDPKTRILANSPKIMAAQLASGMYAVAFWEAGSQELGLGRTVTVDQPCVVLLDPKSSSGMVADPNQFLTTINITVGTAVAHVTLPLRGEAGRSTPFTAV